MSKGILIVDGCIKVVDGCIQTADCGGDDGNTDPCDSGCCNRIYARFIQVDSSYTLVGGILDVQNGIVGSGAVDKDFVCGIDLATVFTRLGGAGTKWQMAPSGLPTFQTVATNKRCPPALAAGDWVKTAGGLYLLATIACYASPLANCNSLPSSIAVSGWESGQITTNTTDEYTNTGLGSNNYPLWDGTIRQCNLNYGGKCHFCVGGDAASDSRGDLRTIPVAGGTKWLDVYIYGNFTTGLDPDQMSINIDTPSGNSQLGWDRRVGWAGYVGLLKNSNFSGSGRGSYPLGGMLLS
jgi:hypothetical protein